MSFEQYTGNFSILETTVDIGGNFQIRSYCDDDTVVYLTKPPICKLDLNPRVQDNNVNIAWNVASSRAPTGTIDKFTIQWGGTTDIGDLINQDWATDPLSGNVQYLVNGRYIVTTTVVDTLGVTSKPCRQVVTIGPVTVDTFVYVATTDNGVWLYNQQDDIMMARNNGLTGNFLEVRGLIIHPQTNTLPLNMVTIWIATVGGPAYTLDGGLNWTTIDKNTMGVPKNDAGDDPAPAITALDVIDIMLNPTTPSEVSFLLTDSTDRVWVYTTTNVGVSWTNTQAKK